MKAGRRKTIISILIGAAVAVLLPLTLIHIARRTMGPMITNDNASIVFQEFQYAIEHGSTINDPRAAAAVAQQAYAEKTKLVLLDGWGRPMHIYAELHDRSCQLSIQSAGPDGRYGTGDDVTISHVFDLPSVKAGGVTPVK